MNIPSSRSATIGVAALLTVLAQAGCNRSGPPGKLELPNWDPEVSEAAACG